MKTKEIEVLVEPIFVHTNLYEGKVLKMNPDNPHMLKARLIIELPEKKIEITESQLEEAFNGARKQYRDVSDQLWHIKQKLFGKEEK